MCHYDPTDNGLTIVATNSLRAHNGTRSTNRFVRRSELLKVVKTERFLRSAIPPLLLAAAFAFVWKSPLAAQESQPRPFNELDPSFERNADNNSSDEAAEQDGSEEDESENEERGVAREETITTSPDDQVVQAESDNDIAPLDDPDPETGPYDPLGIRLGSFLLFPEISVENRYTDNVLDSATQRRADRATFVEPSLRIRSNWSRHEVDASVGMVRSFYDEFTSENDDAFDAQFRGRLDIRRRTNLETELSYSTEQESRSDVDFPSGAADRPDETNRSASLALTHRINHVTARIRGQVSDEEFGDVTLLAGGTTDNNERNNVQRELSLRLAYALRPDVSLFVEGSGNDINFDILPDGEPTRNSTGYEVVGGFSFEVGGKVSGEVGIGYARQFADSSALSGMEKPIVRADLTWRATGLTTVNFAADSQIDGTTVSDSIGSRTQTLDFSVEHLLRRNLILAAGVNIEFEDFAGSEFQQTDVTTTLGVEYLLNRSLALTVDYEHTEFSSTNEGDDYTANQVQVGVRVRR